MEILVKRRATKEDKERAKNPNQPQQRGLRHDPTPHELWEIQRNYDRYGPAWDNWAPR